MDDFMNGFMRIIGWVILYFLWKFVKGFFGNIKNVLEEKPEENDQQERLGYTRHDDYGEYQAYSEYGQSQVYETSETSETIGISGISVKNEKSKANEQKAEELSEKPNKNEQIFETSADPIKENNNDFFLSLTEQSLINSIIMSEVLGPPKAKRKLDAC